MDHITPSGRDPLPDTIAMLGLGLGVGLGSGLGLVLGLAYS